VTFLHHSRDLSVAGGRRSLWLLGLALTLAATGCSEPKSGAVTFYCDGAGWYSSAGSVKAGLRGAGYEGRFQTFSWSAFLGPAHDHFVNARSRLVARRLSRKIEDARAQDANSPIYVIGLSAGTAVVLSAIEQLREGVQVDHVILFSPSVAAKHDLTKALKHIRGRLYATTSPNDGILAALVINADGLGGSPAGRVGFRLPTKATKATQAAYRRVINLPWHPSYVAFDCDGGHTSVTHTEYVKTVIAPRILQLEPHPLDRSVVDNLLAAGSAGGEP
jgi:predicted esterase